MLLENPYTVDYVNNKYESYYIIHYTGKIERSYDIKYNIEKFTLYVHWMFIHRSIMVLNKIFFGFYILM